jgi:uncharacterized protein YggL (DUF469 family)
MRNPHVDWSFSFPIDSMRIKNERRRRRRKKNLREINDVITTHVSFSFDKYSNDKLVDRIYSSYEYIESNEFSFNNNYSIT